MRWLPGTITNREVVLNDRQLKPDIVIILDMAHNSIALKEAQIANVPVIAICDTDCDPNLATYPIPGNDDSYRYIMILCIHYFILFF